MEAGNLMVGIFDQILELLASHSQKLLLWPEIQKGLPRHDWKRKLYG